MIDRRVGSEFRDALGIYDGRLFALELEDLLRSRRAGLGLILADIDNFQQFNEADSPLVRDEYLLAVAKIIADGPAHRGRGPYHLGTDEFAVILEFVTSLEARKIADSLRHNVEVLRCGGFSATLSVGVSVTEAVDGPQELLSRTALAKRIAKSEGGNLVKFQGADVFLSTYFDDLSPYVYWSDDREKPNTVNIGWLDAFHSYSTGPVDEEVLDKIFELCENPVRATRGFHPCQFCSKYDWSTPLSVEHAGKKVWLGSAEIRVPGRNRVFACPTLIYHYIQVHHYRPPQEFLDAVRAMQVNGCTRPRIFHRFSRTIPILIRGAAEQAKIVVEKS